MEEWYRGNQGESASSGQEAARQSAGLMPVFLHVGLQATLQASLPVLSAQQIFLCRGRIRSALLDRLGFHSDACATFRPYFWRMAQQVLCSQSVEHSSQSQVGCPKV